MIGQIAYQSISLRRVNSETLFSFLTIGLYIATANLNLTQIPSLK